MINVTDYYSKDQWQKIYECSKNYETPCQIISLDIIKENYQALKKYLPCADVYYAIKANPQDKILTMLNDMNSYFDIASVYELRQVLKLGISPDKLSYGNTIKKAKDIKEFYDSGVRLFVVDHLEDLQNISKYAPGSFIFTRVLVDELATADWPLSKKFGCDLDMAYDLLVTAKKLNLIPYGVSFHVGSQQRSIPSWHAALVKVKYLFDKLAEEEHINLQMINMGGGFPIHYLDDINPLQEYCEAINYYLTDLFSEHLPRIIIEPGRSLTGNAGVLVSEVVTIGTKNYFNPCRWIYLDVGKFGGLAETLGESIKYPLYIPNHKEEESEVILAGPTCDSADILYEDYKYELPDKLTEGERVYLLSTGAYTTAYSSVGFNGFPPLKTVVI